MKKNKNYGVRTFKTTTPWSDSDLNIIMGIQAKYKFQHDKLAEKLLNAIEHVKSRTALIKSNPSAKEQIAYLNQIAATAHKLNTLMDIGNMGIKIRRRISCTMTNGARKLNYLNRILIQLDHACEQAISNVRFDADDNHFNKIPENSDHGNKKTVIKPMLRFLIDIFEEGSLLNPSVYKSSYKDEYYHGHLFQFCIELIPLLEKKGQIKIGKASTIGDYLIELKNLVEQNNKMYTGKTE